MSAHVAFPVRAEVAAAPLVIDRLDFGAIDGAEEQGGALKQIAQGGGIETACRESFFQEYVRDVEAGSTAITLFQKALHEDRFDLLAQGRLQSMIGEASFTCHAGEHDDAFGRKEWAGAADLASDLDGIGDFLPSEGVRPFCGEFDAVIGDIGQPATGEEQRQRDKKEQFHGIVNFEVNAVS